MRSILCSSAFSNSRSTASVLADSPTLPFHCSSLGYSRCSQPKSSCHLLTSANKCVRSHLSLSGMSARTGIEEDIYKNESGNQEAKKRLNETHQDSRVPGRQVNAVDELQGVARLA